MKKKAPGSRKYPINLTTKLLSNEEQLTDAKRY